MSIKIPEHVQKILVETNKNKNISAEDMVFKMITTSDDSLYLWFIDCSVGFMVRNNQWTQMTIARACMEHGLKNEVAYIPFPLECIGYANVRIYPDNSIYYIVENEKTFKDPADYKIQLDEWVHRLDKKASSIKSRITLQSKSFTNMSESIKKLSAKVN